MLLTNHARSLPAIRPLHDPGIRRHRLGPAGRVELVEATTELSQCLLLNALLVPSGLGVDPPNLEFGQ